MSWYDSYRYVMVRQLQICHHGTTATDMSSWYDSYRYVMVRQLQICHHGTTATDMSSWYDSYRYVMVRQLQTCHHGTTARGTFCVTLLCLYLMLACFQSHACSLSSSVSFLLWELALLPAHFSLYLYKAGQHRAAQTRGNFYSERETKCTYNLL